MRKLIIGVVVIIIGVAAYFGFNGKNKLAQLVSPEENSSEDEQAENQMVNEPDPVFAQPVTYASLNQVFNSSLFSFKYSEGYKVFENPVSPTETVYTVENEKGTGFQIFSMPWDEKGMITPERIWQDEPEADVIEPKVAELDGIQALVFYGYNGDFGETFEVWAVNKGKLFQITGPKNAEQLIIETLETWNWRQ